MPVKVLWLLAAVVALLGGAVCLAVRPAAEPAAAAAQLGPAAYPADMAERAARVSGVRLCMGGALPEELAWQDGAGQPDIGDPAARKGGCLRVSQAGPYPAHWLRFGSAAPQFFHYNAYTAVEVPLAARHPQTGQDIPGTAARWAVQGNTVYFLLNPAARYSNGRPLRAGDYLLSALLRAECGDASAAALAAAAEELRIIDDRTLALTLRQGGPLPVQRAAALLHAAEPGFYAEFGSDYRERYAQRIAPTTGAYTVGRTERGRMAELRRVRDWWARELPYYRHTCNVDRIEYHFLTDEAQAWEFLLRGRLDLLQTRNVAAWQQRRAEAEARGLIAERLTAEYPLPPYGIAFNTRTLPNLHLRRGLMHALDMDRVVDILFRGEGERLRTFTTGYGPLSPTDTPTDAYDPAAARAELAQAGYDEQGADGILRNAAGEKLSIRLTYSPNAKTSTMADVLVASARACGVELVPESVPWQVAEQHLEEAQLSFWATMAPAPLPDYRRFFGRGATGFEAPFRAEDAELEALITAYEQQPSAAAVAAVDRRIRELALWLPGWAENRLYLIRSPKLHLPHQPFTAAAPYEVTEAHLYWTEP